MTTHPTGWSGGGRGACLSPDHEYCTRDTIILQRNHPRIQRTPPPLAQYLGAIDTAPTVSPTSNASSVNAIGGQARCRDCVQKHRLHGQRDRAKAKAQPQTTVAKVKTDRWYLQIERVRQ